MWEQTNQGETFGKFEENEVSVAIKAFAWVSCPGAVRGRLLLDIDFS